MRIDIVRLDVHLGAMVDRPLDHRGDLRRGTAQQLAVDHHRLPLDMPVDQDAPAAVPGVPLGEQVLVPGAEVSRVAGHRGRPLAPDRLVARGERGVGDLDRQRLGQPGGQVPAAGVVQVMHHGGAVIRAAVGGGNRANPGAGPVGVEDQQEPFQELPGPRLPPRPDARSITCRQPLRSTASFSTSISRSMPHRWAIAFFSRPRLVGSGRGVQRRSRIAPCRPRGGSPARAAGEPRRPGPGARGVAGLELGDEEARVQRLAQPGVVLGAGLGEVGDQFLIRVAEFLRPRTQIALAAQLVASASKIRMVDLIEATRQ